MSGGKPRGRERKAHLRIGPRITRNWLLIFFGLWSQSVQLKASSLGTCANFFRSVQLARRLAEQARHTYGTARTRGEWEGKKFCRFLMSLRAATQMTSAERVLHEFADFTSLCVSFVRYVNVHHIGSADFFSETIRTRRGTRRAEQNNRRKWWLGEYTPIFATTQHNVCPKNETRNFSSLRFRHPLQPHLLLINLF